jgi:hypothetical protein
VVGFRGRALVRLRMTMAGARWSVPPSVSLQSPCGRYRLSWTVEGDAVRVERELTLDEPVVRRADYAATRKFFDAILAAEARAAVVTVEGT